MTRRQCRFAPLRWLAAVAGLGGLAGDGRAQRSSAQRRREGAPVGADGPFAGVVVSCVRINGDTASLGALGVHLAGLAPTKFVTTQRLQLHSFSIALST